MYFPPFLISLCFLTLCLPQLVMFTGVNFSYHNIFWADQPWWKYGVEVKTDSNSMFMLQQ